MSYLASAMDVTWWAPPRCECTHTQARVVGASGPRAQIPHGVSEPLPERTNYRITFGDAKDEYPANGDNLSPILFCCSRLRCPMAERGRSLTSRAREEVGRSRRGRDERPSGARATAPARQGTQRRARDVGSERLKTRRAYKHICDPLT